MRYLKIAAAFAMTAGIVGMAPASTCDMGNACAACAQACTDAYVRDTAPGGDQRYSACLNSCADESGFPCQSDTGG